jgi:hypothetical protein
MFPHGLGQASQVGQISRVRLYAVTLWPMAATASSSLFLSRPVMYTSSPSATNNVAVANAIPDVAPVITATLPSSLGMLSFASLLAGKRRL